MKESEMVGACRVHWGDKRCIKNLSQKPEENRPLGRPLTVWRIILKLT
jgi:hypothetical protein